MALVLGFGALGAESRMAFTSSAWKSTCDICLTFGPNFWYNIYAFTNIKLKRWKNTFSTTLHISAECHNIAQSGHWGLCHPCSCWYRLASGLGPCWSVHFVGDPHGGSVKSWQYIHVPFFVELHSKKISLSTKNNFTLFHLFHTDEHLRDTPSVGSHSPTRVCVK